MENDNKKNEALSFNIRKYVTACLRSWWLFLLCIAVCGGLLATYAAIKVPVVEVEASLMLKDAGGGSSFMLGELARSFSMGDMFGGSSTTDNESAMLKSHTVFLRTVKDMGLNTMYAYRKYGFKWIPIPQNTPVRLVSPEAMSDTISSALIFMMKREGGDKWQIEVKNVKKETLKKLTATLPASVSLPVGSFTIEKTPFYNTSEAQEIDRFRIVFMSDNAAAEAYSELVNIYVPDRKADFISLSVATPDGNFGKELLGEIIQNYTDVSNIYKADINEQSLGLVNKRLSALVDELAVSEQDLEQFKLDNKLTDIEVDAKYLLGKTGEIESALLQAQTQFEVVSLTRDFISNPKNNYSLIPELLTASASGDGDNATSQIGRYNELILERMQLLPDVNQNSQLVKKLDEQIDAMRANIISSVNRLYENTKVALNDLKAEDSKTKSRVGELPVIERKYITLKRDNMLMEQMYLFLLQQREELSMSLATRSMPAQIVDEPHVLTQDSSLGPKKAFAVGAVLGVFLAMFMVFFLKMKKAPVKSADEFGKLNAAPLLGTIRAAADTDTAVVSDNGGTNSETMRQLRSEVQDALKDCGGNVVAVTSLHDGEGKTYVAANLAVLLAKVGGKVLLLDWNLRRPGVARMLGIGNAAAALADYVTAGGEKPLAIQGSDAAGNASLYVSTSAHTDANASDILGAEATRELLAGIRKEYTYIVIDTSSIKGYSDVSYVTDLADVTLVVERAGHVSAEDIEEVNALYSDGRLKRLGVVANAFC